MTQPFVVSLKLTGDGRSAVSAVSSTGQALDQLNAKTEAAKAKAEALNATLGRRGAAEAGRSGLQTTLEAIQAEQRLESARLQAQVTEKGRMDSINRLAQLGRDASAVNKAIAASEQQLATAHDEATRAARAAALAQTELSVARSTATQSRQAAINSALGIGRSSSGDRGADIAAYGREMEALRARFVPAVAASQAYNREVDAINQAHRVGAISAQEQAAAIAALDARYRSAAASAGAFQGMQRQGGNVGAFHTTNLLFQAQDIAMMTAMGQAPMMLAMQQGMQVGGIFHQIGNGRQIVQALGGAIVGLLNPLNLATIATIALGAAGVQWFMSTFQSAEDATNALEAHREMLDSVLDGYDGAKKAADDALAAALKLPTESAISTLSAGEAVAAERTQAAMEKVLALQGQFAAYAGSAEAFGVPDDVAASLQEVADLLARVGADGSLTRQEINLLHGVFTDLANTSADQNIREISGEVVALLDEVRAGTAQVDGFGAALRNLPRHVQIRLTMSQTFGDAMSEISDLYMDPRSRFDIARENLDAWALQAQGSAQTLSEAVGFAAEYERVLNSINAAEAEASEKANARGAKSAQKPFDQWTAANDNFQQRIDQQRLEIELLGKSTYEIERQKAAFDLRNQARAAGIPLDDAVNAQIERMAEHYAGATVELERLQERQRLADEQLQFYRGTFVGLFGDMKAGLREGQSFWEAFGNAGANALDRIADRALGMAANGIFDMIFGAVAGAFGGGGSGAWASSITGSSGGIWGLNGFAKGTDSAPPGWAWVGEEGPELVNFRGGERVYSHARSMALATAANQNQHNDNSPIFQLIDQRGRHAPPIQRSTARGPNGETVLRGIVRDEVLNARYRGAEGF